MGWFQKLRNKRRSHKDEQILEGQSIPSMRDGLRPDNDVAVRPDSNGSSDGTTRRSSDDPKHTDSRNPTANNREAGLTLNEFNDLILDIQHIIQDGRKQKDSSNIEKIGPIIKKLNQKVITYKSIVLPPLLESLLSPAIQPLVKKSAELGDKYVPMLMEDIKRGRVDRLQKLMWLAFLNQARLKLMKQEMFKPVQEYIQAKYHDDICSPDGHTAVIPWRDEQGMSDTIWEQVDFLIKNGLVLEREVIKFMVGKEEHKLAVLTMSEVVE